MDDAKRVLRSSTQLLAEFLSLQGQSESYSRVSFNNLEDRTSDLVDAFKRVSKVSEACGHITDFQKQAAVLAGDVLGEMLDAGTCREFQGVLASDFEKNGEREFSLPEGDGRMKPHDRIVQIMDAFRTLPSVPKKMGKVVFDHEFSAFVIDYSRGGEDTKDQRGLCGVEEVAVLNVLLGAKKRFMALYEKDVQFTIPSFTHNEEKMFLKKANLILAEFKDIHDCARKSGLLDPTKKIKSHHR